ncbi:3-deoxy-D-manno-octulosonic acid transferase [Ramlibacter sp. H39-3-26]|uniref:3-deoxy-D-manno-octulosonic acid transferase n=1 Tax=Curvibacter soli TaxID=3031331 RepID=UPI0023DAF412|nr:3-deoxy-D-manno-octulosonic acid transferase [Ramlibacter sp. H39-3-26]MDF1485720.1 3-deoxy-D-manno-octulosonic acid transferase [Ramlibacter sp. H39-3-26]
MSLLRGLYCLATWLGQPWLRAKLARRGVAEPCYLQAVDERFGRYTQPPGSGYIWIHAVSLGETHAAAILLAALRERLPGMRLLLTNGTATGRVEGQKLLREGDVQVWQPWDTPGAVRRFLRHFQPTMGILMETEVWPNLVAGCRAHGVPLALANARLSAKSLRQAERLAALARPAYGALTAVWAQTEADAERLRSLGAPVAGVFGNLKFDAAPDAAQLAQGRAWRAAMGRPVLLLASSREGEEAMWLESLKRFRPPAQVDQALAAINPVASGVQWLVVPRHPQRFDAVAALIRQAGFSVSRRSTWGDGPPQPADIWLGDSLGEMALYYGLADVALLGGSFARLGGQNLIEAAACGCPVVMGPHTFNFAEAAQRAQRLGAAARVASLDAAVAQAYAWAMNPQRHEAMVRAASEFASAQQGIADRMAAAAALLAASVGART